MIDSNCTTCASGRKCVIYFLNGKTVRCAHFDNIKRKLQEIVKLEDDDLKENIIKSILKTEECIGDE